MYGEILREGWASDEKKKLYYDYIFEESERLSRLIANVLQLARMTRNHVQVETRPLAVAELLEGIRSRVAAQVVRAGFELKSALRPGGRAYHHSGRSGRFSADLYQPGGQRHQVFRCRGTEGHRHRLRATA